MADTGYIAPSNAILVAGNPLIQFLKVETATNMYPGRLVITGTNDDDITVCGAAGLAIGWLGYEQSHKNHRPATVDTIYLINAQVAVLNGGGFVIMASLKNGETVVKGSPVVAAASGEVSLAAAMTVTVATGTTAVVSDKAQPDEAVTGSLSATGVVVGWAEEGMTASGSTDCQIRSAI